MKRHLQLSNFLCLGVFLLTACSTSLQAVKATETSAPVVVPTATTTVPDWFNAKLTDATTGDVFTMNDYAGKVVLLETMATWCPTCILQAAYVYRLHEQLGHPEDLISISLDTDLKEDAGILKEFVAQYGFDWYFAIAPLEVDRALGNLYNAEYLNPPLAPMLIIDRQGDVHQLPYGLKDTETLRKLVEPFLVKQ